MLLYKKIKCQVLNKILTISKPRFCKCKTFGTKEKDDRRVAKERGRVSNSSKLHGFNVSCLVWKGNLQVSGVLDNPKLISPC